MTIQPLTPQMRGNFRALYYDIFWFGVLAGSTLAFLSIYLTRLGATAYQIGLLTAGPALFNLFFSLPAGRWLAGHTLIRTTFWSAALHRLGYLVLLPLPWLFSEPSQIWAVVVITMLMSIPGTILAISFNAMFADVVPPDWRAEVVGKRNAIVAVSLTVTTLLCGQLLDSIEFPLNYAIVFTIGVLGAVLSTYYLWRLHTEEIQPRQPRSLPMGSPVRPGFSNLTATMRTALSLRSLSRLHPGRFIPRDMLHASFLIFISTYLVFYTVQYLGVPLFPLVQVRVLNLSDGMISLGSSLFYGAMLLVSLRMVNISTRLGHKRTLATGGLLFCSYPLFLGLANGPGLFWVASFSGGVAWAITNAGLINRLMERVPDNQRPAGMALHNLVLNLGILLGSLMAPVLSDWAGLQTALLTVAGLRLLAGIFFWLRG